MVTTVRDTVEREVVYSQPIERVWAALTEPEQIRRWFSSGGAEIDLRPGGKLLLIFDEGASRGIVETVDPPRRFAFRWYPGAGENPDLPLEAQGPLTLVEFTLEPVADGTRLRLVESGFAALTDERRQQALGDNNQGWHECLASLTELLGANGGR